LLKGLLTGVGEMTSAEEEGEGIAANCPQVSMLQKLLFQGKHWGTLTHWV